MTKSRKRLKIRHAAWKYDGQWEQVTSKSPRICDRRLRSLGFEDGAEWMLNEVLRHLRKKKYVCDKLRRECPTDAGKTMFHYFSSIYIRLIQDLGEWKPE